MKLGGECYTSTLSILSRNGERVAYLPKIVTKTCSLTIISRTRIVPAVFRCASLGKALPAAFTEELRIGAGVPVEFEFERCGERPFAVPADVRHVFITNSVGYNVIDIPLLVNEA